MTDGRTVSDWTGQYAAGSFLGGAPCALDLDFKWGLSAFGHQKYALWLEYVLSNH